MDVWICRNLKLLYCISSESSKKWNYMAQRMNLHGKSQCVLGDKTSHGGVVISGSETNSWHNIPVVRKGDKVYCPKCKPHFFVVAEGLDQCTDTNAALPMSTEGHSTTCGAVLIAESAPISLMQEALHLNNKTGFDDLYVLRDAQGNAMSNTYYGVRKGNGPIEFHTTDEAGRTQLHLTGEQAREMNFYIAG
ncbi:MAG: PAAR domain-containing protein [Hydrogenophaga sp.]|jgi:uncharacterized Zn-binding protein involved in type VI secretion|uniref:PAAR domain-containing protein n=1 Tax=Hydrogenophaga sp. TaxID=1904254 RepID=UPI004036EED4